MHNCLDSIFTFKEASIIWNLNDSTLRYAAKNNLFNKDELRKSANTWLVTKDAMIRLYGNLVEE